jgi:hypothetical protein
VSYRKKIPAYEAARIEAGTLARFVDGLTWGQIYDLDRTIARGWWRGAIVNAEADGMLVWLAGCWWLSDTGRLAIRSVA